MDDVKVSAHQLMGMISEYVKNFGWTLEESQWRDEADGSEEYTIWIKKTEEA